jgi:hypothetical protein
MIVATQMPRKQNAVKRFLPLILFSSFRHRSHGGLVASTLVSHVVTHKLDVVLAQPIQHLLRMIRPPLGCPQLVQDKS